MIAEPGWRSRRRRLEPLTRGPGIDRPEELGRCRRQIAMPIAMPNTIAEQNQVVARDSRR